MFFLFIEKSLISNCSPLGINYDSLHWLFGTYLQFVFCIFSGKRCRSSSRPWRIQKLCRRALVGCNNSNNDRLRRHRPANMAGENCSVMLQCFCDIIFRFTRGMSENWIFYIIIFLFVLHVSHVRYFVL